MIITMQLKGKVEKLDIEKIKQANTKYIGKKIKYFEEISSTHIVAKEQVRKAENGTIYLADRQTSGIGTKGRSWHTGNANNIALTIVIKDNCTLELLNNLSVNVAIAIQKAIKELYGIELNIKEPNDLLLHNKKICGILVETNSIGEKVNYIIISIGFNVNEVEFSDEIVNSATSLKKELKKDFVREEIIVKIMEEIEKII